MLILVRHSQPEIDPSRPASHWHLSAEGRRRCLMLAEQLAAHAPDVLVSSVEPKAVETAEVVGKALGLAVEIAPGLHEHERETVGWMDKGCFQALVAETLRQPDEKVFGEETGTQARDRFAAAVLAVQCAHPGKTVIIVTHGTVMALYVAATTGADPVTFWRALALPDWVALGAMDSD